MEQRGARPCPRGRAYAGHVLFTNNQLRLDGPMLTAFMDACVLGATAQMCDNRLQDSQHLPVLYSGMIVGIADVTAHNIATFFLKIMVPLKYRIRNPNAILWPLFYGGFARERALTRDARRVAQPPASRKP